MSDIKCHDNDPSMSNVMAYQYQRHIKCQVSWHINVKSHGKIISMSKLKCHRLNNAECQISRSCEISTMLHYNQSVQIRHQLYTDFKYFQNFALGPISKTNKFLL